MKVEPVSRHKNDLAVAVPPPSSATRDLRLACLILFLLLVLINRHLFGAPSVEYSDLAVNSIQIHEAKHLRELHGNYSRWGFHHPGPGLFYLLALGESVFTDLLHLTASPFHAHRLTMILISVICLYFALRLASEIIRHRYFVPVAILSTLLVVYMTNATGGSAGNALFTSIWIPHTLLFPTLLFAIAAASVASGRMSALPHLTSAACLLTHLHIAQILFTLSLSAAALAIYYFRELRGDGLGSFLRKERRTLIISAAILGLFLLPIVLELVVFDPNNFTLVMKYMKEQEPSRASFAERLASSFRYFITFFAFMPESRVVFDTPPADPILLTAMKETRILLYYLVLVPLALAAGISLLLRRTGKPFFVMYLIGHAAALALLFIFWGTRITGDLFSYHGHFFYVFHILLFWIALAVLLPGGSAAAVPTRRSRTALFAAPAAVFFMAPYVAANTPTNPFIEQAAASLEKVPGDRFNIEISGASWQETAGIANQIVRAGRRFCTDPGWSNLFGTANACAPDAILPAINYGAPGAVVGAPCVLLAADDRLSMYLTPRGALKAWPVRILPSDCIDTKTGFHLSEGPHRWASGNAAISLLVSSEMASGPQSLRVRVIGSLPLAPLILSVNGAEIGRVEAPGEVNQEFPLPAKLLRFGARNELTLHTPNASRIGGDPRQLGFLFRSLDITP